MSRFEAIQCDRCKVIIQPTTRIVQVTTEDKILDLCGICSGKLKSFLEGQELEEPP